MFSVICPAKYDIKRIRIERETLNFRSGRQRVHRKSDRLPGFHFGNPQLKLPPQALLPTARTLHMATTSECELHSPHPPIPPAISVLPPTQGTHWSTSFSLCPQLTHGYSRVLSSLPRDPLVFLIFRLILHDPPYLKPHYVYHRKWLANPSKPGSSSSSSRFCLTPNFQHAPFAASAKRLPWAGTSPQAKTLT